LNFVFGSVEVVLDRDSDQDGAGRQTDEASQVNHHVWNAAQATPGNARCGLKRNDK